MLYKALLDGRIEQGNSPLSNVMSLLKEKYNFLFHMDNRKVILTDYTFLYILYS